MGTKTTGDEWTRPGSYANVQAGERVRVKWAEPDTGGGGKLLRQTWKMGTVTHTYGEGIGVELDDKGGFILVRCCDVERLKRSKAK